jgi:hypothetical protein
MVKKRRFKRKMSKREAHGLRLGMIVLLVFIRSPS